MEYCVVSRSELQEFEKTVANYILAGWKPVGGVFVVCGRYIVHDTSPRELCVDLITYYQAMTRIMDFTSHKCNDDV